MTVRRAERDRHGVAEDEPGGREGEVERSLRMAARRPPERLLVLARQARALGARRQLELIAPGALRAPPPPAAPACWASSSSGAHGRSLELPAQRPGRVALRGLAQRRSVPERERRSLLAVAERQPAHAWPLGCDPARCELGREPFEPGASKRASWQREATVSTTSPGRVSDQDQWMNWAAPRALEHLVRGRVADRLGPLDHEHAPPRLDGVRVAATTTASSMSATSISDAPLGVTQREVGARPAARARLLRPGAVCRL